MQTASSRFSKGGPRSWGDTADECPRVWEGNCPECQTTHQADPVLARVLDQVVSGLKSSNEEVFKSYSQRMTCLPLMGVYSGDHEWSVAVQGSCSAIMLVPSKDTCSLW